MVSRDHLIPNEGKALLSELRGERLDYVEGYRIDFDEDDEKTSLHGVARLHFGCGEYDLRVGYVHVYIADDFCDDVGALSFAEADGDIWVPEGVDAYRLRFGREIDEVLLANDYDILTRNGEPTSSFAFTKAVLFRSGLDHIAFAIDDFSEDAVVVRRGFDPDELVPDGSGSWYEEPGWSDEYSREFERL